MRPVELSFSAGDVLTVTKKDPNGWWEAEFNGKKGVIPSNYVQDYTSAPSLPALPVSVPVSVPSPVKQQEDCQMVVDFNGSKKFLKLPVGSLDELQASLRQQLGITSSFVVTVLQEDFQEYIDLEDISFLPEKPKLKIVAQAMSWWGWSVDSTWATKGFETTRYSSLLVKEGAHIHHQPALDKFNSLQPSSGLIRKWPPRCLPSPTRNC